MLPEPEGLASMDLSIAIALNSPKPSRLVSAMDAIAGALEECGVSAEFLLIGVEPPGELPRQARGYPARVIPVENNRWGTFLRAARESCRGDWVVTLESPAPEDASLVFGLWNRRADGDLFIASRYVRGGSYRMPWTRAQLSRGLNWLYRVGLAVPVRDLSSARRMYRVDLLRQVDIQCEDYDVLMEVLLRTLAKGGRVIEVPWHYEARPGRSASRASWRLFKSCLGTFGRMHALRNSIDFPDYDARAYDSRIWLQRYWQRTRFRIITRFCGPPPQHILDAGCGSSRIITSRPEMVAMDINFARLRYLRGSNPRRVQATAGALPFAGAAFDTVISSQVIEHTPETTCLSEAVRVLRPGGKLIVGTPDYATFWWPIIERIYGWVKRGGYADEHITHYTRASLEAELKALGCEMVDRRYIGGGELIILARKLPPAHHCGPQTSMEAIRGRKDFEYSPK